MLNHKPSSFSSGLILFAFLTVIGTQALSQTVSTSFNSGGGGDAIVFNFENTNAYDVVIKDVASYTLSNYFQIYQLWYKPAPLTGTPGAITAANGWIEVGSHSFNAQKVLPPNPYETLISGMNFMVPAGATYRLALTGTGGLRASNSLSGGTYPFTAGGCKIITGTGVSYYGQVTGPVNTQLRAFMGSITFVPAAACSGAQVAGNTIVSLNSLCANTGFTMRLQNAFANGSAYQWQSSPAGTGWTNIAGATQPAYVTSQSALRYYRCAVTCSGNTVQSTPARVASFCPCSSKAIDGSYDDADISNVTFGSLNNSSACNTLLVTPGSTATGYSNYMNLPVTSVMRGSVVPFSFSISFCYVATGSNGDNLTKMFMDFNHDSDFTDPGEEIYCSPQGTYDTHIESDGIFIPSNADTGYTLLRVVNQKTVWPNLVAPCGNYGGGETEDYIVNIKQPPSCGGTPAIAAIAAPDSVCSGNSLTLHAFGFTTAGNISYQWQQYNQAGNSWTAVPGGTNPIYCTLSAGISSTGIFRLVTTCSASGLTSISNVDTVNIRPWYECYCGPNTGVKLCPLYPSNLLRNVRIAGTGLNNTTYGSTLTGSSAYTVHHSLIDSTTATLLAGSKYLIVTKLSSSEASGAWIDYDHSGAFDASEFIEMNNNTLANYDNSRYKSFTVPLTAVLGQTMMRVRANAGGVYTNYVCTPVNGSETEDYIVTIAPQPSSCSGTPAVPLISGPLSICKYYGFYLSSLGYTAGPGVGYQWQSSPAGAGVWAPISGATDNFCLQWNGATASTDYRLITTCASSGLQSTSNTWTVSTPSYNCYCSLIFSDNYSQITNVNVGSLSNSSACGTYLPGIPYSLNVNADYAFMGATPLLKGALIPFSLTASNCSTLVNPYGAWTKIFIDYNHDGDFSAANETVHTSSSLVSSGNFTIPAAALDGIARMRVVHRVASTAAEVAGCSSSGSSYGDVEDYLVDIVALGSACSGTPSAGSLSALVNAGAGASFNVCRNTAFSVSATGYSKGAGIAYQWQSAPAGSGSWSSIVGASNCFYYTQNGIQSSADYRMIAICSGSGLTDTSDPVSLAVYPGAPAITASGPTSICPGDSVILTGSPGLSYDWGYVNFPDYNNRFHRSVAIKQSGEYSVIIIDGYGCMDTAGSVTVTVKPLPSTIKTTAAATVACAPTAILLSVNNTPGSTTGFSHQWSLNGTSIPGAIDTIYTTSVTGAYTLTVSDGVGCTKTSNPKTVTINPTPTAGFTAAGPMDFCQGGSVTLNAQTTPGATYSWLKNGAGAGSGVSKTFSVAGDYTVVAKLNGCNDTASYQPVVIHPIPVAAISTTDPTTFCDGEHALLSATPVSAGYSYKWKNGSVVAATTSVPEYLAEDAGIYKVTVTSNYGCISPQSTSKVKLVVNPMPNASITAQGSTTIAANGSVKLKAQPGSLVAWQWYKDNVLIVGATTSSYIVTQGGDYTVAITKTGCTKMSAPTTVTQLSLREELGSLSNNGSGEMLELAAFPNPVNDILYVNIRGLEEVNGTIYLMDANGKLVTSKPMTDPYISIDMSGYASGVYIIRFRDNDGRGGVLRASKQ
jgi:hypothetical protein